MRERDFRWDFLPNMMDERDELEKIYYGIEKAKSDREEYNAKRLFEMISVGPIPKQHTPKVAFSTIVELARTMPDDGQLDFIVSQIERLGLIEKITPNVKKSIDERLRLVKTYVESFEQSREEAAEKAIKLSADQKALVLKLVETIESIDDADELQSEIFNIAKSNSAKPSLFFKMVYQILFSSNKGPRLGPYIIDAGKEEIIKKLKDAM
jgi:lysyl-tRNA synthetase class 1